MMVKAKIVMTREADSIGERIRLVRKRLKLSQVAFCKEFNISQSYLSALENNIRSPKPELLEKIAGQGFDLNWLLQGTRLRTEKQVQQATQNTKLELCIKKLAQMDEDDLDFIRKFIDLYNQTKKMKGD